MKKAIFNKSGMKQIIDTGFKIFDKQTNLITTGNVIANTQFSNYIRPYNETKVNGITRRPGVLMNFDLQYYHNLPKSINDFLKDINRKGSVILYEFHYYSRKRKLVVGYVVTDRNKNLLYKYVNNNSHYIKRLNCLYEVLKYITNE